jgi:transposase
MMPSVSEELIARQNPEAQQIIRALLAHIAALNERLTVVQAALEQLQQRPGANPQNSSAPPSSVHPHAKPAPKKPKRRRKRGGQHGHPRHIRPLLPSEQCDQVVPLLPPACRRCGETLRGQDPDPLRHQVYELPEIKPLVTEYQLHRLFCPCCHETTCATLPQGVPSIQAGPRLVAFTATLMAYYRQSKRRTAAFLGAVFGIAASAGWVVKLQGVAAAAAAKPCKELTEALPQEPVLGIDESPTKQGKDKAWLWTFVGCCFTVFACRLSRGADVLTDVLGGAFPGVTVCDRAKMYFSAGGRLQWCWAHLRRDFQALIDHRNGVVQRLGHDLMRQTRRLFELWAKCRDGTLSRAEWQAAMPPVRQEVERLLLRGLCSGSKRLRGMCKELSTHRQWLWTFVDVEGVEPTNNASERSLRHAVIWRKLSFGTQSAAGSVFVERMLTVIETCRQQKRDVLGYLSEAVRCHFAHQTAPSLLPTP